MYTIVFILLLALAAFITYRGITTRKTAWSVTGIALALLTMLFFWFMGFWGEKLWFDQLGYGERFWTVWLSKIFLFTGTFIAGTGIVYLLTLRLARDVPYLGIIAALAGGLISGLFWASRWEVVLAFLHRIATDLSEPILNQQTGFYLFSYPFLQALYGQLLLLVIIAAITAAIRYAYLRSKANNQGGNMPGDVPLGALYVLGGIFLLVLAFGKFLARYGILFSEYGIVSGPGWTDVNIRLPMLNIIMVLTALGGIALIMAGVSTSFRARFRIQKVPSGFSSLIVIAGSVFAGWILLLGVVPMLLQYLKVEPNEITLEKPYIEHNIRFTQSGYHLDKVEKKEYDVSEAFSRNNIEENRNLFSNIRLWDYRALDAVFKQFQEIRLYYEFRDVDIDRYMIDSNYRQVMVSAREMQPDNLPVRSQTFVNRHFKYTHGHGAVLNLVNEFTEEGLPNLLIRDIPPVSSYPKLEIKRPEIYYGELPENYVLVNSEEKEFDYPSGEENIYSRYAGDGGVQVSNFWRKLIYGWSYGGTRFLLSGYPTDESRIMIHRQIIDRVKTITPFLSFDNDPYIVIADGKMYWIIDAYTSSNHYPYSEPFASFENARYLLSGNTPGKSGENMLGSGLQSENYIRNSVKIVVDAYNGKTDFYIFEEDDPLIRVYDRIFPGLLKSESEMPAALRKHVRYPADMLLIQGLVYAKYHMTDPTVFYNQEDLWVRSTEKYYSNVQPVEPYYIMWEQPGSDETEFILMLPFTPKNKQVMIGWIAGMCDDENYGRFLAYQFPKEKRVLGTQQVETKIDQDSYLSGQLTLWDQRGSNVIRGNVLAIPVNGTIIYVEPIYLQSETSAYPELRLVAVMHNDNLSYAETFDQALENLFTDSEATLPTVETGTEAAGPGTQELIRRANEAFENYLEMTRQKQFRQAGNELEKLENALQQLSEGSNENEQNENDMQ